MPKKIIQYTLILLVSVVLIIYIGGLSFGEKKIKKGHVPEKIKNYIRQAYKGAKKIKYYIESDKDTTFYEVELIYQQERLSLTFMEDGSLYELEKKIKFDELAPETQQAIEEYLTKTYVKYKINRIQFVNPHLKTEYELNVKVKSDSGPQFYELFFNEKGEFIASKELISTPIQTLF